MQLMILALALAPAGRLRAQSVPADRCVADGGTAICRGPELGQFAYGYCDSEQLCKGGFGTEAEAVEDMRRRVHNEFKLCSSYVEHPGFIQMPAEFGARAPGGAYDPPSCNTTGGVCRKFNWDLGEEINQQQSEPINVRGIRKNSKGACVTAWSYQINEITRGRARVCPSGFARNSSGTASLYCWRAPGNGFDPRKNLGKQCNVPHVGHPINVLTGNKFLELPIYRASGSFPLEYTLTYNSLAHTASGAPGAGPAWLRSQPNWRSSYQRAVFANDHPRYQGATVYRHDGRVLYYEVVDGRYISDADVNLTLERIRDSASGVPTGWRLTSSADETEVYDAEGRLISITNRGGLQHLLSYDNVSRLISVRQSNGMQIVVSYGSGSSAITLPDGGKYTFKFDSYGNLTSITGPDQHVLTLNYQNTTYRRALTRVIDENNAAHALYAYGSGGRATSTELAGSVDRYTVAYTSDTRSTVTDPLLTSRTYDSAIVLGMRKATVASSMCKTCGGKVKASEYDANGNPSRQVDFNGNEVRFTYDLTRNLETSRIEAFGTAEARTIYTEWHPRFRSPLQIDEQGKRAIFSYDTNGNMLEKTEIDPSTGESRTWSYAHNEVGQIVAMDGPRTDVNDVTTLTYYACSAGYECGQIETITNALDHVWTYGPYNAHGQPLAIVDPNGTLTVFTYDTRQRMTSRSVGGETSTFEYWPTGKLKALRLPNGRLFQFSYDAAHRLTGILDSENNQQQYMLDAMGNVVGERTLDSGGTLIRAHSRLFDALGRLLKEIGAAGTAQVSTTFDYDGNGNPTRVSAPLLRNTAQEYDELNRLRVVTDPSNGITEYDYDALDHLIIVTDPRGLSTYDSYNGLGDLKERVSPDTGRTVNSFDAAGNLRASTDARNVTTTYSYDALNRLTAATYGAGGATAQTINYAYDAGGNGKGQLTSAWDEGHSLAWTYDPQGRVTSKRQVVGAVTQRADYSYDRDHPTALTTPSGQVIGYGYTNDKITSVQVNGAVVLSSVVYEAFGAPVQWIWGNGSMSAWSYDQDGKLTRIEGPNASTYVYDDAFRIVGIAGAASDPTSWTYGYDEMDRLVSAATAGITLGYRYDANGNRVAQLGDGASTYTLDANSNRLAAISGAQNRVYGYTEAGSASQYGGVSLSYDDRGRVESAAKDGVTTHYAYNARGELVRKSDRLYYYDEAGHVLGQYTTTGALIEEIVWFGDMPVATLRPNLSGAVDIFYIHSDHVNTPRMVTQSTDDAVRWRWDRDPFGGPLDEDPSGLGTFEFDLRFPGQVAMPETGLYYNYFRDYDPEIGRYVQSDPLGVAAGTNTYAYVDSRPTDSIDPMGLVRWTGYVTSVGLSTPRPRPVAGALYHFSLTSECKCGRQMSAEVTAWGLGSSTEKGIASAFNEIAFNDIYACPEGDVFNGWFWTFGVAVSAGVELLPGGGEIPNMGRGHFGIGLSISKVMLGDALSEAWPPTPFVGKDNSITGLLGHSWYSSPPRTWACCNGD